jgi:hypothetical protein
LPPAGRRQLEKTSPFQAHEQLARRTDGPCAIHLAPAEHATDLTGKLLPAGAGRRLHQLPNPLQIFGAENTPLKGYSAFFPKASATLHAPGYATSFPLVPEKNQSTQIQWVP